jgi:pyruvate/2-oxoglutarate dehydrogenase complex dihydrolipoamide dehydrogenase (E3) component
MIADPDVLVIGAGPAGLSAARVLKERGVDRVLVVDREVEPGGIPRFCPHPTFGLTDYFRPMSGPSYVKRLASQVDPATISTQTTVTVITPELRVTLSRPDGEQEIAPKRILLATGIRETPRSARLVSGDRPLNVLTTGALQRMVAVSHHLPFQHPVIVGTELVSFSAVLTLRDCGVRPVAMVESDDRIRTLKPADTLTQMLLGTPVITERRVVSINAAPDNSARLESITMSDSNGTTSTIACDAVIFTGCFVPEASLLAALPAPLTDAGSLGPAIDQSWRLAEPRIYAAGNVLRSVETAAWSAREGASAGTAIADDLQGKHDGIEHRVPIICSDPVKFVTPSAIAVPGAQLGPLHLMLRMKRSATGRLTLGVDGRTVWQSPRFTAHPERRLRLSRDLPDLSSARFITVGFDETR